MEEITSHHTLPVQPRFDDVGKFGYINNTIYFSFYDLGKTEYLNSICPGVDWEKIGIVVIYIEVNFVKRIFASNHITIQAAISKTGTKSLRLVRQVIDTKTDEVKYICKSIMATFNLKRHKPMPPTKEWIETTCKHEGRGL